MHGYNSSTNSEADNDLSDLADPLHDEDILEELFYKEVSRIGGTTSVYGHLANMATSPL